MSDSTETQTVPSLDPTVVYCMSCGNHPGSPHLCEACQVESRESVLEERRKVRRIMWGLCGLNLSPSAPVPALDPRVLERGAPNTLCRGPKAEEVAASAFVSLFERELKRAPLYQENWHHALKWVQCVELLAGLELDEAVTPSLVDKPKILVLAGLGEEYSPARGAGVPSWRADYVSRVLFGRRKPEQVTIVTTILPQGQLAARYGARCANMLADWAQVYA